MGSLEVPQTNVKFHLVFLISLSFAVTETRRLHPKAVLDLDSIVFPSDDRLEQSHFNFILDHFSITTPVDTPISPEYGLPDDLIEAVTNLDETKLFEYFGENIPISDDGVSFSVRFGDRSDAEENNENFVSHQLIPSCRPRPTCVPVETSETSVLILEPPCLMVPRCGACCHFGRKCLPVATETFTYSIQEIQYAHADRKVIKKRFNVTEEHHKSCTCQCNIKLEDCLSRGQILDNTKCKCVCRYDKLENRFQCLQRGREWNPDSCTCDCRVLPCEEGYFFNKDKCKCDF